MSLKPILLPFVRFVRFVVPFNFGVMPESGGAIYDYLHLAAARKAGVKRFFTLNTSDFISFHRPGDPEIDRP